MASEAAAELRAVVRRLQARSRLLPPERRPVPLEETVGGRVEPTERGEILVVSRRFAAAHCHGSQPLGAAGEVAVRSLALLGRSGAPPADPRRLCYLDTETTGLAGGTGTYVFLVGVGFFDGAEFEVRQYFLRDLDEEPALLSALDGLFRGFEGFVTYNGAGFDLPLLETRFVLGRRRWREVTFHLDLLPPARRLWSAGLADCRLASLERHVLAFERVDDVPGFMIPGLYFDYLRRRSPSELPRIFEHNRWDVLSLAALVARVGGALERAPEPGSGPEELVGLGRLWEAADPERGWVCYRTALERGLPSPARERLLLRLGWAEKRRARWDAARALWEEAVHAPHGFDARPWEELAKLYEHRLRDLHRARAVVEEALARARAHRAPAPVAGALEHRLGRLRRRLGRAS